jgi:putative acetyltransferase
MIEVKIAVPDDYPEIVEVWEASVRATHHFLTKENIQFFKPLIPQYLGAVQLFCVKGDKNKIEGFLGVAEQSIEMLFLHPSAIGKGMGKKLVRFAIESLQVNKVDVNEQNEQAVNFYKHMGFHVINRSATDGMGKPFPILHMELSKTI